MLLNIYISSVLTSIIVNNYNEIKTYLKSKKYADEFINYDELSNYASTNYKTVYEYFIINLIIMNAQNFIPFINFITSYYNITYEDDTKEDYMNTLSKMTKLVNKIEHDDRIEYYKILNDLIDKYNIEYDADNVNCEEISFKDLNKILNKNGFKLKEEFTDDNIIRTIEKDEKKLIYKANYIE